MIGVALVILSAYAQVPLEPSVPGLLFGSWYVNILNLRYDRLHGDTPAKTEGRVGYKPFSIWQSDMNITATGLQTDYVYDFSAQVDALNTDAILYPIVNNKIHDHLSD
jgi:hypothetical protein